MNTEELVDFFFKETNKVQGKTFKRTVTNWVNDLLKEGIPEATIVEAILTQPGALKECAKRLHNNKANNILAKGTFYFHPMLQIAPPPAVVTINPDGTFSRKEEEFYLKIKESFTMDDILEHFYKRFPSVDRNQKRDIGAMEYLLNKVAVPMIKNTNDPRLNAIDLLLFTIDAAVFLCEDLDQSLTKIFDLTDYMDKGLLVYQDKKEACIIANIDHVI